MKLNCNHKRRAMVLPSGKTVHRSDGSWCDGAGQIPVRTPLTIGGNKVTKLYAPETGDFVSLGMSRPKPGEKLLREIFEGGA